MALVVPHQHHHSSSTNGLAENHDKKTTTWEQLNGKWNRLKKGAACNAGWSELSWAVWWLVLELGGKDSTGGGARPTTTTRHRLEGSWHYFRWNSSRVVEVAYVVYPPINIQFELQSWDYKWGVEYTNRVYPRRLTLALGTSREKGGD